MKKKQVEFLSEALFKTITDPILIHPLEEEGYAPFELVNKAAIDLYGYTEEELYKLTVNDISKTIFSDEFKTKKFRKHLRRVKNKRVEAIHVTKSGKNILVDINLTVVRSEGREMILSVIREVINFKDYEKKLFSVVEKANDASKMLEDVINNIPVRIFWKDTNLNYLGCNRLFAEDAGKKSSGELIGDNDYNMLWAEQADLYRSDDKFVIDNEEPKINYEEIQTNDEGAISWLRTSKIPLINNKGLVKGVLGVYEDITLRKQQELELKKTQEELFYAQKLANLGRWSYDIEKEEFTLCKELAVICGYANEKLIISYDRWENEFLFIKDRDHVVSLITNFIKESIDLNISHDTSNLNEEKVNFNVNHRVNKFDDKTLVWLNVIGEYFEDEKGRKFIKGTAQDFTKLRNNII